MRAAGNVFLVGPMGAGKSTIGRLLARDLNLEFLDSDHEVEARTGASVALIFDVEGERGFRSREASVIADLTAREGILLSTGGGAVLDSENRRHLASRGTVIYLQASVAQQLERTRFDRSRPLLRADDPEKVLTTLLEERDPLYREVADIVVATDGRKARAVASDIVEQLKAAGEAGQQRV